MSHSRLDTDVVIAGAGMIGLATACALGQQGLRVQVVDPRFTADSLQQNDAITLRVCALSPASLQLLRNLGAWSPAQERRACSYSHMHVVDVHSHGELHFNSDEIGQSRLGAIVENAWVESALLSALQQQGVHSPKPNAITHFASEDDHISVKLDSKERIRARLLIAADGARSKIRESISDQISVHDYAQSGLVTTISAQSPHLNTARQRFLGDAILGLLPLFNGQYSIVWSLPEKQAREYQEMPKPEFLKVLNEASGAMIGDITDCGERGVFPLRMQIAQKFAAQRCALIGDAAHVVHPLAGLGANLGFADVAVLAELLDDAKQQNRDIGSAHTLEKYARLRRGDVVVMGRMLHGIHQTFAGKTPLAPLRRLGMNLIAGNAWIRQLFSRQATGLQTNRPTLMKPHTLPLEILK